MDEMKKDDKISLVDLIEKERQALGSTLVILIKAFFSAKGLSVMLYLLRRLK